LLFAIFFSAPEGIMAVELIFNICLLILCGVCYYNVSTTMPKSAPSELGAEQWPEAILIVLVIAIIWNIVNYFRRNKKEDIAAAFKTFLPGVGHFVKSKLFIGMALLVAMAIAYEPLGFITTCFIFLIAYGFLLGAKKVWLIILTSLLITVILYIGFGVLLGIMLPRGQIPFLRNMALAVESIFE
jgi:uncharacterized membrane protein